MTDGENGETGTTRRFRWITASKGTVDKAGVAGRYASEFVMWRMWYNSGLLKAVSQPVIGWREHSVTHGVRVFSVGITLWS